MKNNEDEEISIKETITEAKEGLKYLKKRMKDWKFWIDNFMLIGLLIGMLYLAATGYYTDQIIVPLPCNCT